MKNNTFERLCGRLGISTAKTQKERFNEWMRDKVKSKHYSDNGQMTNAFNRIIEY